MREGAEGGLQRGERVRAGSGMEDMGGVCVAVGLFSCWVVSILIVIIAIIIMCMTVCIMMAVVVVITRDKRYLHLLHGGRADAAE